MFIPRGSLLTSGGLLSYTIGIHYLMTSDSIWTILCYSGIILYAVCSSGFHAEGFLNALTCFSMFLRWNPCIYTEASPCSASFSSDSFNLSKACSAEDLLPSKARYLILDRKSTRLNSSHYQQSRMPSSA